MKGLEFDYCPNYWKLNSIIAFKSSISKPILNKLIFPSISPIANILLIII